MLLSKNKSEKNLELAKSLIKEMYSEIKKFERIPGQTVPTSTSNDVLAGILVKWFEKPHVKKAMKDLGIDLNDKGPNFNTGSPTVSPSRAPVFPTGRRRVSSPSRRPFTQSGPTTPPGQDTEARRRAVADSQSRQRAEQAEIRRAFQNGRQSASN